jgi:yeast amino acid transporter
MEKFTAYRALTHTSKMMFNVVYALGELAILYPISGGFYTYSVRFIDPSWGFAMGYNYVFQWAIVLPLELVVAGLTLRFWDEDGSVHVAVWVTIHHPSRSGPAECVKTCG